MDTQTAPSAPPRSALFTVRLWIEELGAGKSEVRMQVKHVVSGETCYFRDWAEVVAFLLTKLSGGYRKS